MDPGTAPGAGALVFGSFQALEAAKTQDCCSKMHVRKCCFFCPPPNYCSAGGMIGKKKRPGTRQPLQARWRIY